MKKVLSILLASTIFFWIGTTELYAAPKKKIVKPITKHKIEFTTKDGFILAGDLYFANKESNKPLVVMLHSFGLSAQSWKKIAENLRLKDYNALAMDLRGHGRSVYNEQLKLKSRYYFQPKDWLMLPKDIVESIEYVTKNYPKINTNDIIIVGADIGANAGFLAGEQLKHKPKKFVLVSPMLSFKGLQLPPKCIFNDSKFLILLSKSDNIMFYTQVKPIIKRYEKGGPGNLLLNANPESQVDIINFIIN